ncbi:ribitol-5-phosphate dehydrogenase [Brochothrix campestris]|uniref:Ribulose-5-phosphate reductase n=1 Tax=Brochothrix campestris FSL F6-1037 TaxID=1265861 RepID=W7CKW6_9LIST|nr:ribitol-5-phosphate dehydrogenase [Brochothrix campestris]EUJ37627.1 zinc-dependent alcohol dehydrogenase [Brochothrix campestris FSL F6-1037]
MINQVYKLVAPRRIEVSYEDISLNTDKVIVRPKFISICKADQRYYTGTRGEEILKKKLPMALTHESVGEVSYDPTGALKRGQAVIMVPNTPYEKDELIGANYLPSSKFRSSASDGFTQDYIAINRDRLVVLPDEIDLRMASFSELISVAMHGISRFEKTAHARRNRIAVWGNGSLGYIATLILKKKYPDANIIIVGRTQQKLDYFSFADEAYTSNDLPADFSFDHAFECVGGNNSGDAVNQIIDYINPLGYISLLGVSEDLVPLNTRMVLEKGLTLQGSTRSEREDFENVVAFFVEHPDGADELQRLIGQVIKVRKTEDIIQAFEKDLNQYWGKTVMEWQI